MELPRRPLRLARARQPHRLPCGGRGGAPRCRGRRRAGDVIAVAAVQEETGFAGSRTTAYQLEPDVAIAVDVTFATDQPGIELGEITKHGLGSGPVIARGTMLHPSVFELLHEVAEAAGDQVHGRVDGTPHRHRCRRDPHLARRHAHRPRIGAAALHAQPRGDGQHRGHRRPRRGCSPPSRRSSSRGCRSSASPWASGTALAS